jgi:dTDP-4-amino-4,6-dideoxygalactose transaminase
MAKQKSKWIVNYLDLVPQYKELKKEIDRELSRIMGAGDFILRKDVGIFEENMAKYLGVKYVVGVNSGTDALYLSLKALGIEKGDEVITSCLLPYSVFAILNCGAKPILVDVKGDFNIDERKIEKAITKRTKAIIPVHLNGRMCDMNKIIKLSRKYNLKVIEDAAQSLGATFNGKKSGTFGLLGCFSVHPMKNLSCAGDGGFISTNNKKLAEKLKSLRNLGKKSRTEFLGFGYNSRLDNLQAALLNVKLKRLDEWIRRRQKIAFQYDAKLLGTPIIIPMYTPIGYNDVYNSYIIRTKYRDELLRYLIKKEIECFVHYPRPTYKIKSLNLPDFKLFMTEKICKEVISLPINPHMTNRQINYVVRAIKDFFKRKVYKHSY